MVQVSLSREQRVFTSYLIQRAHHVYTLSAAIQKLSIYYITVVRLSKAT
jgi:hypothetical protein